MRRWVRCGWLRANLSARVVISGSASCTHSSRSESDSVRERQSVAGHTARLRRLHRRAVPHHIAPYHASGAAPSGRARTICLSRIAHALCGSLLDVLLDHHHPQNTAGKRNAVEITRNGANVDTKLQTRHKDERGGFKSYVIRRFLYM